MRNRDRRGRDVRPASATASARTGALNPPARPVAVDYTLFARRRIGEELDVLLRGELSAAEWDGQVARLARMGPEVVAVILDRLRRSALPDAALYARLACELAGDRAKPALVEVLRERTVGDSVKLTILHAMEESGLETGDLPLDELLSDPQAALRESEEMFLRAVAEDERALAQWVQYDEDDGPDVAGFAFFQVQSLGERRDDRAAAPLHIFARYPDEAVQSAAIQALSRLGCGRALTALDELASRALNRSLRRAAQQAAERLRRRGVRPAQRNPAEHAGHIAQIHVTSIDGAGSRILRVVRKRASGRNPYTHVIALLNTRAGLKDVHGAHDLSSAEIRRWLAEMREDGTRVVPVDAAYAGNLFRDALATARRAGTALPLAYCYWQDFLPADWLEPQPYEPHLEAVGVAPGTASTEAVRSLWKLPELDSWLFDEPAVYEAAERLQDMGDRGARGGRAKGGRPRKGPAPRRRAANARQLVIAGLASERLEEIDAVVKPLYDQLLRPALPELARRLALTSDLLRLDGKTAAAAVAGRVACELRLLHEHGAGADGLADHPFLTAMLARSLFVAADHMAMGLDPRINPDAFV